MGRKKGIGFFGLRWTVWLPSLAASFSPTPGSHMVDRRQGRCARQPVSSCRSPATKPSSSSHPALLDILLPTKFVELGHLRKPQAHSLSSRHAHSLALALKGSPREQLDETGTMPRDKSNPTTKKRSSEHAAQTGLKTGNVRVKGENFYRDAKSAKRVNLLSGKSSKAIRDKDGKILQAAEFQSSEVTPGRVQPDRRWFGNTRVISQTALDHFRENLKDKVKDPYAVVLKQNKLPMSLLTDAVRGANKQDLTTTEPFSDTFGTKAQRKRPRLDVGSINELASKVATHQAKVAADAVQAEKDQRLSEIRDADGSLAPEILAAQEEEKQLSNVPQDYILSAGTSKRIWGELYKVIDSSDVLLHVLDARDPMGTRCESVEAYLAKEKRGKKVVYVLNKVDLVPGWVAARWVKVLSKTHPTIAFHASINNSFGKGSLIQLLRQFSTLYSDKKQISVGFIGYPNVGKSSIINTLKKKAVCKTAPIPGETKVWQYITLMRRIYLIDCPGIVPPSARDTESQKVLKGIVRVEHLSDPASHIQFLLDRVRKEYLVRTYGVQEWTGAEDFLTQLARKGGKLLKGGEADYRTVATMVINDWIRGKIPFYVPPPEAPAPSSSTSKSLKPSKLSGPSSSATMFKSQLDDEGNTVRKVPGVQQPLHQIVHSTKFLPDDIVMNQEDERPRAAASGKRPAGKKRTRAIDVVSSDEESDGGRPAKEKRMTTNKKKATNYYTHANVKNKSRRGGPVKDQAARKAAIAGGSSSAPAPKGHAGTSKKRAGGSARRTRALNLAHATRTRSPTQTTSHALVARQMSSTRSVKQQQPQEDTSVGPMYRFERTLPSLPVPTLEETAERYLASIRPYHTAQEPSASSEPLESWAKSEQAVKDFVQSPLVNELQQRLQKRAQEKDSWLSEWWNETAYFGWRGPVVPGVNYYYAHKDDRSRRTGPARAAGLLRALLYFRRLCNTQQLEPEMARKTPLCMSSYKYLFNATRLPTSPSDTAKIYDPETHNHIVVVRKNKFYEVPVVDEKGEWLSEKELEVLFKQVVDAAGSEADPHPVGALTAADRDTWTQARTNLIQHDAQNEKLLERIESAIIVVSLDSNSPYTREEHSWGLWVGDGKDRWFDKHQLIVFENGKSGFNGEHSCMDGTPTSRLNDWLLRSLDHGKIDLGSSTPRSASALPKITPLAFNLPESVKSAISSSISAHESTMSKHDLAVLEYAGYGKDQIKQYKTSPDSYAQLVMGLAYYKMEGKVAPTYESAQTRKYKLGRTEVIRSTSPEALEWYKAMEDPKRSSTECVELFRKAAAKHIKLAGEAADGRGVDRHLFGLKKVLKEGENLPALYQDPTFAQSGNWILSTSQLSSEYFAGWGYGEVVDEGYGLAYAVNNRTLRFTITSMNRGKHNNVHAFRHYLEQACNEVREMMEKGGAVPSADKAKL
uniref:Nucleolar GTP-binding protein 2 n=2 Tax=Rhodotorula toruloides TaxID=5286 RepID=A0A0K3CET4_RHOTO